MADDILTFNSSPQGSIIQRHIPNTSKYDTHLKEEYLTEFGAGVKFMETGTYRGETVQMVYDSEQFNEIWSVELDQTMYQNAVHRFADKSNVHIIFGESPDAIRDVIANNKSVTFTFWLDAHASGPLPGGKYGASPLVEELEAIMTSNLRDHTIFIDDRRLFGSAEWDFLTEERVMETLKQINPNYQVHYLNGQIEKDVICATCYSRNKT